MVKDGGGVEPSGEQDSDRKVSSEATLDRTTKRRVDPINDDGKLGDGPAWLPPIW